MRQSIARNPLLFALGCLGILGLVAALFLREQSFPVATVDFRILGPEAEQRAATYVRERGFSLDNYRSAVAFGVDDTGKNYVQREAGLSALNSLARDRLAVWYWHVRFFRELQEEEFSVYLTPDGRLAGFFHTLPEASSGGSPELATAQATAEAYLGSLGRGVSRYRLVSSSAVKRPARTDTTFTWEERDFSVGKATARVDVWLLGDQIGGFNDYLKVPEDWRRAQAVETNRGNVLDLAGWLLTYALVLAMAYVCLLRIRAGGVCWRFAVGLAVVLALIGIATGLNSVPLLVIGYPTTSTFGAYVTSSLQRQAAGLIPTGVAVVLAGIAGDWLYGRALAGKVRPSVLFSLRGLFSVELPRAIGAGYAMAGIWLGYVTAFYTIASRYFGAWSPAEVPYQDLMSTYLPGLYPLTVGFGAAVSEEMMFRMFAVPFFLWLGWRWLEGVGLSGHRRLRLALMAPVALVAVVVPAAIWGSLHSTYPQQPFYARAVELTIEGSLSALVMFRFGILAAITAHYVYNASVIGGLFLLSSNNYLRATAVVVVCLPLIFLVPALLRRRSGLPLRAAAELAPPVPAVRTVPAAPVSGVAPVAVWAPPLTRLREPLILGIVCLAVALVWQVPRFGDEAKVSVGRAEADATADAMAPQVGLDPSTYMGVTSFADLTFGNSTAYLLRRLGTAATNRFLTDELPSYAWQKRYFRPLDRHELTLRFDQRGRFQSLSRTLPEDEAGARLSLDQARGLAEDFVRRYGRADALNWELVTASSNERTGRTDHVFEWEDRSGKLGDAALRLRVGVLGDSVGEYTLYLKVPEAFDRELASRTDADVTLDLVRQGLSLAVFIVAIALFIVRFRKNQIDLRFAAVAAGLMAILSIISRLNQLPIFFSGYWTTIELQGYEAWQLIAIIQGIGGDFSWQFILFGGAESLYRSRFPNSGGIAGQLASVLRDGRATLTAGLVALSMAPVLWVLLAAYRAARDVFAQQTLVAEGTIPAYLFNTVVPAMGVWQGNLSYSFWVVLGGVGVSLWLWARLRRPEIVALIWVAVLTVLYMGRPDETVRTAIEAVRWLAFVVLIYVLASRYVGRNLLGYGLILFTFLAGRDASFLIGQPQAYYAEQGIIAMAGSVAPAMLLLLYGLVRGGLRDRV